MGEGPSIHWDLETDFIVAGTGAGGLTGAIVASDLGLNVIILEKSSMIVAVQQFPTAKSGFPEITSKTEWIQIRKLKSI